MNMLFDPLVKAMMSRFGGLEALGFYEMANKLILQGRAIIVEASRVMVPAVATLQEHDQTKAAQLFATTYRLTFYISVLFYGLLGISITSISVLWLGHYQETFILYSLLLTLGWFMNTLIGPAYFSNLGSGKLKENMISHAIMGMCSLIFGVVLGKYFGGDGVVVGTVISLIAGSMYLLITYIKHAGINLPEFIIPQNMISLFMLSMLTIILANYGRDQYSANISVIAMALLCGVILLSLGWLNPARKMLSGVLKLNNRKDI
jgi:O-antigen/teichoic acid export membrane protein